YMDAISMLPKDRLKWKTHEYFMIYWDLEKTLKIAFSKWQNKDKEEKQVKKMGQTQGKYVIQTKAGHVVRVIEWPTQAKSVHVIQRKDTGRLELITDISSLESLNIDYKKIADVDRSQLNKKAISLSGQLELAHVNELRHLDRNVRVPAERQDEEFQKILKWTGAGHIAVVILILLIGYLIAPLIQPKETVVKIVTQDKFVRPKFERKTVKMSETKIDRTKKVTKRVVSQPVKPKKYASKKQRATSKVKRGQVRTKINVAKTGALGVLGGLQSGSKKSAGLNLNSLNNSRGSGVSGVGGAGGHQRALPGKGLIASGVGSGGKAEGAGGYGTRGKGGGRAGYGKMSMVGSSGAYSAPLHEEALVQGGLDRDQIHAVIQKHMGQIVYCYEKGLQVDPSAAGRVNVNFVIGGSGLVASAKVASSSVGSNTVDSCIVNKLSGWKFPKPHGNVNVKVSYPFELRRVGQG
ncbi:MAG: AgmX/PglI C-terminal domain-containing protein, partial [Bdellovibrionales bacterium]|nr:AgmX/PglI C-terminal domain-containing protein [Bdellovibrionales bacterium]